jgi:hypothetical protein
MATWEEEAQVSDPLALDCHMAGRTVLNKRSEEVRMIMVTVYTPDSEEQPTITTIDGDDASDEELLAFLDLMIPSLLELQAAVRRGG